MFRIFKLSRRHQLIITAVFIFVLLTCIYIAGFLIPDSAVAANFSQTDLSPSLEHIFGTDWLGRDLFLRTIKGLSISITIGLMASFISAIVAIFVGISAAMGSKMLDRVIAFAIDLIMSVPHTILVILISFACGRGFKGLMIGLAVTHWASLSRLIRGEVLQLRSQPYIAVSRSMGKSSTFILVKHIMPHIIPQFIVGLVLMFPHAILHESAISFLGYGLSPEQPAIGIILAESMTYLTTGMWWLAVFPGLTLVAIVLLFDKLGDTLKTVLNPFSAHE